MQQEVDDFSQFHPSKCTLPLARIKKIMKFDEDVKVRGMFAGENALLFVAMLSAQ